jgi:DNA-directed RNA polymerase specialized sigma24 family protein
MELAEAEASTWSGSPTKLSKGGCELCVVAPEPSLAAQEPSWFRDPKFPGRFPRLSIPFPVDARVGLVLDFEAPSSKRVVKQLDTPGVRDRLVQIARWSARTESDPEDLVAEALLWVLDPDRMPWVPEKKTFLAHMAAVIHRVWSRQVDKERARQELLDSGFARDEYTPSPATAADDELDGRRTLALWHSLLEGVLAKIGDKHPLTRPICDLAARGVDEPAEQARILGCRVEEVYRALETLQYHGRQALEAWELAEQRRMNELREAAKATKEEASP